MLVDAVSVRSPAVSAGERLAERALEVAYRAALGVLGSREAAEDVAQDVAIKALARGGSLRHPERADAWLYRVAVRAALREARRARLRRRAERELEWRRDPVDDPAGILVLLDGLPPRQRAALTLRYVFDLSDEAIAAAIGCREATVRAHLHQGRAALRARLGQRGDQ